MKIELNKKQKNEIEIVATLKERKFARDPHERINNEIVLDFLKSEGYNLKEWNIVKSDICTTGGKKQKLSGTWVFKKIERKNKNDNKARTTNTKQPKTTRTRRRKAAPKLLGNEDVGGVQSQTQTSVQGQDKEVQG